ncbi:TetR/AcrR family transcriptional regulator [Sphingomonas sp. HT-1]|uniref:TetR/AcrR family transcriptional regulator n=1 Tax=unclassified Sphingomonas TaxID=196159 RepID=UPI000AA13508|nr:MULTISPECIES: TetR/AcrR family transcriptional regulator [unclassified Sphingomonas]
MYTRSSDVYGVNKMENAATEGRLRPRLIEAAMALLDQAGTEGVTLRALAKATGVSAMAPYRHFADKAALLGAVAEAGFALLAEALAQADRAESPRAALLAQGLAYFHFAQGRPALFRLMFGGGAGCDTPPPQGYGEAFQILSRRVATLAAGDPASATMAAWGTVHGLTTLALDGKLPAADAPIAAALGLLVNGIAADQPRSG